MEFRSITQSIREVNRKADFLEAFAKEIDPKANSIVCESVVCDGNSCEIEEFTVEYDRLVVTVGVSIVVGPALVMSRGHVVFSQFSHCRLKPTRLVSLEFKVCQKHATTRLPILALLIL